MKRESDLGKRDKDTEEDLNPRGSKDMKRESDLTQPDEKAIEDLHGFIFDKATQWLTTKFSNLDEEEQYSELFDYLEEGQLAEDEKAEVRASIRLALGSVGSNPASEEANRYIEYLISHLGSVVVPVIPGPEGSGVLTLKELSRLADEKNPKALEGWAAARDLTTFKKFTDSNLVALVGWVQLQRRIQFCIKESEGVSETKLHESARGILRECDARLRDWKFNQKGFIENNRFVALRDQFTKLEPVLYSSNPNYKFIMNIFASWYDAQDKYESCDHDSVVIALEIPILERLKLLPESERSISDDDLTKLQATADNVNQLSPLVINKILLHALTQPLIIWSEKFTDMLKRVIVDRLLKASHMQVNDEGVMEYCYPNEFIKQLYFLVRLKHNPELLHKASQQQHAPHWYFPCNLSGISDEGFSVLLKQYTSDIGADNEPQWRIICFYNLVASLPPAEILSKLKMIIATFPTASDTSSRIRHYNRMLAALVCVIPDDQKINVLSQYFCKDVVDAEDGPLKLGVIIELLPPAFHWDFLSRYLYLVDDLEGLIQLVRTRDETDTDGLSYEAKCKLIESKISLLTDVKAVQSLTEALPPEMIYNVVFDQRIRRMINVVEMLSIIKTLPPDQQMLLMVRKVADLMILLKHTYSQKPDNDIKDTLVALEPLVEVIKGEDDINTKFLKCYEVLCENSSLRSLALYVKAFRTLHEKLVQDGVLKSAAHAGRKPK